MSLALSYITLLSPLLQVDSDDLSDGLRLFREPDGLGAFDAVLASASLRREYITALVSADTAFAAVRGLTHVDPAGHDFRGELGI